MRYIRLIKNLSNWWLYLAVKLGLTKKDPLIFRTRRNIVIEAPRRLLHEFKEIFMEDCYTRGLELKVPDNPTIIDIGANAGFFTLFAASRFPGATIFSYEPIAVNFKQLVQNKELNKTARIFCCPKAVYGRNGKISLSFDPSDSFTTSATVFEKSDSLDKTVQIDCVTLPEIFDKHNLTQCNLLKIDCEGSEYSILYNCPENYLHRIVQMSIEVHGGSEPEHNIDSLSDYLNSHDFETRRYSRHMLTAWRKAK